MLNREENYQFQYFEVRTTLFEELSYNALCVKSGIINFAARWTMYSRTPKYRYLKTLYWTFC